LDVKKLTFLFRVGSAEELVEDVEDALILGLSDDAGFLQQIRF
jgi:hypothetical protein